MSSKKIFKSLYWKISAIFLLILVVLSAIYIFISINSAQKYAQEVNQKLNATIAQHTIEEGKPFVEGEVNKAAIQDIMHSVMVINPSTEVYLLNPEGKILTYVAPHKKIKLEGVSLQPIKAFLKDDQNRLILGDDPRHPDQKKIFSAAPVLENGILQGYVYVVLASEEYVSVTDTVIDSYILKIGTTSMLIALIASVIIGSLALWFITKNLSKIINTVRRFQNGDLNARVEHKSSGELNDLGVAFNDMADTIVKNMDELKGLEKLRRELLANVSHDLRTPITSIYGYTETLLLKLGKSDQAEQEKYLKIIHSNTERLSRLVDQLFEFSKLEAQQVKLAPEPFSIAELIQDIAAKYQLIAEEKQIEIKTDYCKELPLIYADLALVDRAVQNLMDNALKFCDSEDTITLECCENGKGVEVKISDTGCGIAKDELPLIFNRYHKSSHLETETASKAGGSGLGLSIVKKILELHKSYIFVSSEVNKGTTFSFSLPLYSK